MHIAPERFFFIIQRVEFYAVINKNQQFTSLDLSSSTEWKRNLEVRNSCLFNIYKSSVGATILGIHKSQIPRYFELCEFEVPAISKEDRMPLDLPFPFTLPRLFRSPAISNFFFISLGTSK